MLKKNALLSTFAALVACAACCLVPLVVASGVGGGMLAGLSHYARPGTELVAGTVAFVVTFAALALYQRRRAARGCGTACARDASCCGATERAA